MFISAKILLLWGRITKKRTDKEKLKRDKYAPAQSDVVQTKGLEVYTWVKIIGS